MSLPPRIPVEILLVENNEGDARLALEAMRESKLTNRIQHVRDGEQALDYLFQRGEFSKAQRPGLVLLDLNLPRKNGREVLTELKADPHLRRIPVVILTASRAEEDIARTYDLHANCYVVKPLNFDAFTEVVQSIENFWLTIVEMPAP